MNGKAAPLYDGFMAGGSREDELCFGSGAGEWVYEGCPWVNLESIKEQIWSPEYPESRSIRFFLNRPNAAEASWITLEEWTQLRKPDRKGGPGHPPGRGLRDLRRRRRRPARAACGGGWPRRGLLAPGVGSGGLDPPTDSQSVGRVKTR